MYGWPDHACRGCSMVADQVAHVAHLNARDTTLAFASRAPQPDIARVKARMGWTMPWYTMTDGFDTDFGVDEWHGTNAFIRDGDRVFRTYFVNNRGDEALGSTWSYLDITALGRQEEWEDSPEGHPQTPPYAWWNWHDEYGQAKGVGPVTRSASRVSLGTAVGGWPPPARCTGAQGVPDRLGRVLRWRHHRRRGGLTESLGLLLLPCACTHAGPPGALGGHPPAAILRRPVADHHRRRPRDLDELHPRPYPPRAGERPPRVVRFFVAIAVHATCCADRVGRPRQGSPLQVVRPPSGRRRTTAAGPVVGPAVLSTVRRRRGRAGRPERRQRSFRR